MPPPPSGPRVAPNDKYAAAALADELRNVETAPEGQRNHILNTAAFNLKSLVNAGTLDEDYLRDELTYAARRAGLDESEIEPTIRSGFLGADAKVGARTVTERPPMHTPQIGVLEAPQTSSVGETDPVWGEFPPVDAAAWMWDDETPQKILWGQDNDILWADGEALMIAGGMGLGKTTLAGNLIRAQLGLRDEVLGLPVARAEKPILYLAMDRPRQIRRSMRRQFPQEEASAVRGRLIVRPGPPITDMAVDPTLLARMAMAAGAGTVYLDSLKDAVIGLSEDAVGAGYNRARQYLLAQGINLLELHHNRKATINSGSGIGEVFGSTWLTSGAGSVIMLFGEPGDLVIKFHHRKTPADEVGPFHLNHDPDKGSFEVAGQIDLVIVARNAGAEGLTAKAAAGAMYEKSSPTEAECKKAQRQLDKLVRSGLLTRVDGHRGGPNGSVPTVWFEGDQSNDEASQQKFEPF